MKLESINCNHCGAPLEVSEAANFVTCHHCDAQLAIKRTSSASFTEEIAELAESTSRLNEQLAQIAYQNELERLDRDWQQARKRHGIHDQQGSDTAHFNVAMAIAIICGFVGGFLVVGSITFAISQDSPAALIGLIPGLIIIVFAWLVVMRTEKKKVEYLTEKRLHHHRRKSLSPADFRGEKSAQELTAPDA